MRTYVNAGDVATEPISIYVPNEGVAAKALKLYTSVDGVAKLFWNGGYAPINPYFPNWEMLGRIVKDKRVREFLRIGQTLWVSVAGDKIIPITVAAFRSVSLSGGGTQSEVPIFMFRQASASSKYSNSSYDNMLYSTSEARSALLNDVLPTLDNEFSSRLGTVQTISIAYGGGIDVVHDKLWLASANEVGLERGTGYNSSRQQEFEGDTLDFFLNINSNSANEKRVVDVDNDGLAATWWLRSSDLNNSGRQATINTRGAAGSANANSDNYIVAFCAFTG